MMKILLVFTFFFSLNSYSNEKICHRAHKVKKSDNLYSIWNDFAFKSHFSYKNFIILVKKENGMTKGSDIKRMRNKFVSLPFICQETKRNTKEKKIIKATIPKSFRKLDLYDLEANTFVTTLKSKKKINREQNILLSIRSTVGNYNNNKNQTTEISPLSLVASHDRNIFEKIKNRNTVELTQLQYSTNLDKALNTYNTKIATSLYIMKEKFKIFSGIALRNINYIDFEDSQIDQLTFTSFDLKSSYPFQIMKNNFDLSINLESLLVSDSRIQGYNSNKSTLSYIISGDYSVSLSKSVSLTKYYTETVKRDSWSLGFNYFH